MSHRILKTSANNTVNHSHPTPDWTAAEQTSIQADMFADYPGIQAVDYVHLDLSHETMLPTRCYNCWGFTFNPRQCWISTGNDVQTILTDNGTQVYPPNLRLGDVICYRDSYGVITHTGRIVGLSATGQPTLVQSKWGATGEYLHAPANVPSIYGTDRTYWRVTPLSGKGDAWVSDNSADDRLPNPVGTLCCSPDLWLNNHGGTYMENANRGNPNNIYVRVHNPDTLAITGAEVRVYWCNPTTGMPHDQWNLIGTTTVNVPAGGIQVTSPVVWTPSLSVPDHACLFAIVNTGDDPRAAATLDPIVWPFDWAFDNNIVWHNLNVIWVFSGAPIEFYFEAHNPFPWPTHFDINATLEPIGPKEILTMNLNPRIAYRVVAPVFKLRSQDLLTVTPLIRKDTWRQVGVFAPRKKWRVATPTLKPGEGEKVTFKAAIPREARPGTAYRLHFEQQAGGRLTGAITFVLIVKDPKMKVPIN